MIVSFSGSPGSGKSGIAERLAKELGWPYYDIGMLRRRLAGERGMTLEEYNTLGESDPSTDLEVDNYQKDLGTKEDNFIITGRTSWHFIPHSFKIYLFTDMSIGAERIFNDVKNRNEAAPFKNIEDVIKALKRRIASDDLRYKKYFNIEVNDLSNYDWVLDTGILDKEEAFTSVKERVVQEMKNRDN